MATVSFAVSEGSTPQATAPFTCEFTTLQSQMSLNFEGGFVTDSSVEGTVGLDYNNGFITDSTAWTGAFSGDDLTGAFAGQYLLGTQGLDWSGTFTASR